MKKSADPFYAVPPRDSSDHWNARKARKALRLQSLNVWTRTLLEQRNDFEISLIRDALIENNGIIERAAYCCGENRTTLVEKMRRFGIDAKEYRRKKDEAPNPGPVICSLCGDTAADDDPKHEPTTDE